MHELAQLAVRTESGQVVGTQNSAHVSMATMRTVSAETTVVPGTVLDLALRIDVKKGAFLVVARIESRVEVTLGHLGHVVLVQELALVTLLAEAAQPMFADDGAIATYVPEGTGGALLAF